MFEMLMLAGAGVAAILGHVRTRQYVRARLRFVDVVQSPAAPVIAGIGAALLAAPVVWLLPVLGAGTALVFGAAVGSGAALGSRDVRRLPG